MLSTILSNPRQQVNNKFKVSMKLRILKRNLKNHDPLPLILYKPDLTIGKTPEDK